VDALRRRGAEPIELPTIRIVPARDRTRLTGALLTAVNGGHDWIAFTSVNAVRASAEALLGAGRAGLGAGRVRIAVVGGRTADAVTDQGGRVDIVADPATAEGLVGRMVESGIVGKRILYPHGDLASDVLPRRLIEAGAVVDAVEAYRTEWETEQRSDAVAAITTGNVDIVTFASPSSIRAMLAVLAGSVDGLASARVVCIGPVTANAARALGVRVDAVADDASLDGILSAVMDQSRSIGRRRERSAAH
jgi:uroporphyrinogen-III synthase